MRTPTPAGLLSALRAAHGLVARYAPLDAPPAGAADVLDHVAVCIPIVPSERWCGHCGDVVMPPLLSQRDPEDVRASRCCSRPQPVPVVKILQPEEYYTR